MINKHNNINLKKAKYRHILKNKIQKNKMEKKLIEQLISNGLSIKN